MGKSLFISLVLLVFNLPVFAAFASVIHLPLPYPETLLCSSDSPLGDDKISSLKSFLEITNSSLYLKPGRRMVLMDPFWYSFIEAGYHKNVFLSDVRGLEVANKKTHEIKYFVGNRAPEEYAPALLMIYPEMQECLKQISSEKSKYILAKMNLHKLTVKSKCLGKCRMENGTSEQSSDFLYSDLYRTSEPVSVKYVLDTSKADLISISPNFQKVDAVLKVSIYDGAELIKEYSYALYAVKAKNNEFPTFHDTP